ncbi:MAG: divalent metal cation transporter [Planctomycetia bacterium]|jgi:Mn2+/Fe2+ NRAMP family transporter
MADENKGLPMAAKWDPEKLNREVEQLKELNAKPFFGRLGGYVKRSGPGLLQSAMTLGAGSAAASVMAGASFGYKLLWVQPLAMFLGIMMLMALGNIVLTTGERPYKAFGREFDLSIGGSAFGRNGKLTMAFFWALGTVMASIIWHFPQYGLASNAAWDMAKVLGATPDSEAAQNGVKFGIGGVILLVSIITTWNYGGNSRGIKIYEWFLRIIIASVIISFGIVVFYNIGAIEWDKLGRGFLGLDGIPKGSILLVLGMLGAAVGINMTFLYPYSLLAKGWGKHHKGVQRADLAISMFIPFVLVTSLMMLAMTVSGVYDGSDVVNKDMNTLEASKSLANVMGPTLGRVIFNLGFIGMTCGAISTHMVVCGFTFCEMFGLEYTVWRYRLFSLVPAVGYLGVITQTPMWFPVVASAICFTMLPIAYIMFLVLNNKRSYIGDAVGKGFGRLVFNVTLVVALIVATSGAIYGFYKKVILPIEEKIGNYYITTSTPENLKPLVSDEETEKATMEINSKLEKAKELVEEDKAKKEKARKEEIENAKKAKEQKNTE